MTKRSILICLVCVSALLFSNQASASSTEKSYRSLSVVESDSEIIVETVDHSPVNETTQEAIEQIEALDEIQESIESNINPLTSFSPNQPLSGGGLFVTFDQDHMPPSNAQTIIITAANMWDELLVTNPNGPIEIFVSWRSLNSQSILGYGGAETRFQSESLPTNHTYPAALTNTLLGIDANGSDRPEIEITINSDLEINNRWYISNSTTPAGNQIDLLSVALHEISHGLGFTGSAGLTNGDPMLGETGNPRNPTNIYDSLIKVDGTNILDKANPDSHLESNNLDIDIGGGYEHKVYDPYNWQSGSSFSHFNESSYPDGYSGSMMSPVFPTGKVNRQIDAPILGVFQRIGWVINPDPIAVTLSSTTSTSNSISASWFPNLKKSAPIPSSLHIRLYQGEKLVDSQHVSPKTLNTTITGLKANTNYNLVIKSIGDSGTKTTQKTIKTKTPAPAPAPVSSLNYRDVPLDGQIYRLYKAYFLRDPDQSGFTYWRNQRAQGVSIVQISQSFRASPEFNARYGSLNNQQFVSLAYQNVLKRQPDSKGYNFWVTQLNSGMTKGEMITEFSESAEFISRTKTAAPNTSENGQINRLYSAVFLRPSDTRGLNYWLGVYAREGSLEKIAQEFTNSPEFASRYGNISNQQFVNLVYQNVLKRSPDSVGYSYWVSQLNSGLSKGEMITEFSESYENIIKTGYLP